jgi:membrane protein DedA with SNARE-associated domain
MENRMVEQLAEWIVAAMALLGYPGLVLMMALESMVAPVPSEIVMPFAGFLVAQGQFTILGGIVASSFGTILGSLIGYFMGKWGGYPMVIRFGRYLLLDREHLDVTVRWFKKRGEITILICRFVPVVRHLISIPAGVGGMNLITFSIYTLIGGTIWNTILLFAGIWLGDHWGIIHEYSSQIDKVMVAVLAIGGAWWVWRQLRKRQRIASSE